MTLRKRFKEEVGLKPEVLIANYNSNYIDWLESQLTRKRVEDCLPEKCGSYLCTLCFISDLSVGTYEAVLNYDCLQSKFDLTMEMEKDGDKVTHWLSIPNIDNTPT
jgi:hypothetical protein